MKKQDERILDMMARLEVVQSRVMAASAVRPSLSLPQTPPTAPITQTSLMQAPAESQHTSQPSHESQAPQAVFDETQRTAIQLLRDGPKDTRQLTNALGKSREHTARVMKELFERGLVKRNDATKPFVYQLTAEGSRYLV
jgi:predicted HTH transcriptional regulator